MRFIIAIIAGFILLSDVNDAVASKFNKAVIARINNQIITKTDLDDRYSFIILTSNLRINSPQEKQILLSRIVDKMVDEEIIRQEAQSLGIEVNDAEIGATINQNLKQSNQKVEDLKGFFAANNLSFANYEKQIMTDLLWTKIITQHLRSKVAVSDSEVKEILEQNNIDANITKFHLAEIFIPKKSDNDRKIAEKLAEELKKGVDFDKIVQQFSSNTAQKNGDLGWVDAKSLSKAVFDKISKLEKGQYSDPILLDGGYHIFKVLNKKTVNEIGENDLQAARNIVFINKLQVVAKSYLMDLKKKYFIEY